MKSVLPQVEYRINHLIWKPMCNSRLNGLMVSRLAQDLLAVGLFKYRDTRKDIINTIIRATEKRIWKLKK